MASLYLDPELTEPAVGDRVALGGAEARHAVAVARMRTGERLWVGDGAGLVVAGVVVAATSTRLELAVDEVRRVAVDRPEVLLVQALAKGDRDELAVQASTELGVTAVVPWAARRSVSRWEGPKREKGEARWRAIAHEASKQSLRAWLPRVEPLATLADLTALARSSRMLVLEPTGERALTAVPLPGDDTPIALVVGPEGGIDPAELAALAEAGAEIVRLGDTVLRTSTAGPAALAVLNARLGRW